MIIPLICTSQMKQIKYSLSILLLLMVQGISFCQEIDVDSIAFIDSLPVEIIYNRSIDGNQINLGRNHFLSFPGSFDDPSRLLIKYPGISTQNDQANFIIYDGMPPHYVKWTLYDADIINPNHLSNAGTISDRNSRASGGVNSFSGQVLGNFSFRAQPGLEGDQLTHAGSADMKLRTPFENKMFFNISAIGLEAGLERKLNETGSSNLLLNYRYSFTGLLGQMGVDFGGEVIGFQDVMAKIEFDDVLAGKLSLFGMYGDSYNDHAAQDSITKLKDGLDIRYDANIFITGVNHVSDNTKLQSSLVYSSRRDKRISNKSPDFLPAFNIGNSFSELKESRISLHSKYRLSNNSTIGIKSSYLSFEPQSEISPELSLAGKLSFLEFYPYFQTSILNREKLTIDATLGAHFETAFEEFSVLPGVETSYLFAQNWSLDLSYNFTTQMQAPELYQATSGGIGMANRNLKRSRADHLRLALRNNALTIAGFYHHFTELASPLPDAGDSYNEWFTDLSNLDIIPNQALGNIATADILGVSVSYDRNFLKGMNLSSNFTFFDSKTTYNSFPASTPYDFGSVLNLRLAKRFELSRFKYLNISTAFHYRGGGRELEIDLENSRMQGRTIYDFTLDPYDVELSDYHRLDLRISYVKKKSGNQSFKSVISLDIQNLYGKENDAFNYYDPVTEQIELQRQLGTLPVISYRLEF